MDIKSVSSVTGVKFSKCTIMAKVIIAKMDFMVILPERVKP